MTPSLTLKPYYKEFGRGIGPKRRSLLVGDGTGSRRASSMIRRRRIGRQPQRAELTADELIDLFYSLSALPQEGRLSSRTILP